MRFISQVLILALIALSCAAQNTTGTRAPGSANQTGSGNATGTGQGPQQTGQGPQQGNSGSSRNEVSFDHQVECLKKDTFVAFVAEFKTKCSSGPNAADATAFDTFCEGTCFKFVSASLSPFYDCMGTKNATYWKSQVTMCDKEGGVRCGVLRARIDEPFMCSAGGRSKATCTALRNCVWSAESASSESGSCEWKSPSVGYYPCSKTGCAYKMILGEMAVQAGASLEEYRNGIKLVDSSYCLVQDGVNCYEQVQDLVLDKSLLNIDTLNADTVNKVCATKATRNCFVAMLGNAAETLRSGLESFYKQCIKNAPTETNARRTAVLNCANNFFFATREVAKLQALSSAYCATSDSKSTGTNCLIYANTVSKANSDCFNSMNKGTCSDACDASVTPAVTNLGCCGYHIARMTGGSFDASKVEIPSTEAYPQPKQSDFLTASQQEQLKMHPFAFFRSCKSMNSSAFINNVSKRCEGVEPGKDAPRKALKIALAWNAIQANPSLKAKLESSLSSDIATQVGLSVDAIVNGTLSEDKTRKVKVAKSSGRSMHALQEDSSASTFSFALVGASTDDTTAASNKLDSKVASNDLALPATSSVATTDCTTCVDSSASSGSTTGLVSGSSSTSAAGSMGVAIAVTIAAIVGIVAL